MGEAGLARTFDTIKETTGLDLVNLINQTMSTKQGNKELVAAIESQKPVENQSNTDNERNQSNNPNNALKRGVLLRITTSGLRSKAELMMSSGSKARVATLKEFSTADSGKSGTQVLLSSQ